MVTKEQLNDYMASNGNAGIGGYPLALIVECEYVCPTCAHEKPLDDREREHAIVCVYYEGPDLYCADCNRELQSAYGDCNADWQVPELIE